MGRSDGKTDTLQTPVDSEIKKIRPRNFQHWGIIKKG